MEKQMENHNIDKNVSPKTRQTAAESLLRDFQDYLEAKQMSVNTIRAYTRSVEQYLNMYGTVSHDNLKLYKCYLMEHYKPQTVNLRIRSVNCFAESLHLAADGGRMTMIHIHQRSFLENVISRADYEYLKRCLLRDGDKLYYFIIRIMAATGMRISELVRLRMEHVRKGYLDLYSKGSKSRRIYIPLSVRRECLAWLKDQGLSSGPVFLNRNADPLTPASVRKRMKQFTALYGLEPSVLHPHAFRHLFAKNFIEVCGDLSMLSDLLGHESIETTRIYLHRSPAEQKKLVNRIVNW